MEGVMQTFCTCGICRESVNFPKKLKCQHSFCHECVVEYIREYFGKSSFPCPMCNFKHLPDSPDTEIGDNLLAILEEDSLARDLRALCNNGGDASSEDGISRALCRIHDDYLCEYYCPKCNQVACELCKMDRHQTCTLLRVNKNLKAEGYYKIRQVTADIDDIQSRMKLAQRKFSSKLENVMPEGLYTVSDVKAYYANLKEKTIKYLAEQEELVLAKAKELEEKERECIQRDFSVCESVGHTLNNQQKLASELLLKSSTNPSENLVIAGHLVKSLDCYRELLSGLETDASKFFDVRFMINTSLEDKLAGSDIVKIEVLDSIHAGPVDVTFDDSSDEQSEATLESLTDNSIESGAENAQATEPSERAGLIRQEAQEGQLEEQHPSELSSVEEEPPPTYTSVIRQSLIPRRRPFGSSISRQNTASAIPFSNRPDNYSRPPVVANTGPVPQSGNASFSDIPPPMSPFAASPVVPSAPPVVEQADGHSSVNQSNNASLSHYSSQFASNSFAQPVERRINKGLERLEFRAKIYLRLSTDTKPSSIVGIARVGNNFVVADQGNHSLKVVSESADSVINEYKFEHGIVPWDVATISDTECVVTAPVQKKLLFVSYPCPYGGNETKVSKIIETGQYSCIGFDKTTRTLICGRSPPFSAARIDLLSMEGRLMRKINIKDSFALLRDPQMTEEGMFVVCELKKHRVFFHNNQTGGTMKVYTGNRMKQLVDLQSAAILPRREVVLILDGHMGDLFLSRPSGAFMKTISRQVLTEGARSAEVRYMVCPNAGETTLAVAYNNGYIRLYDMY